MFAERPRIAYNIRDFDLGELESRLQLGNQGKVQQVRALEVLLRPGSSSLCLDSIDTKDKDVMSFAPVRYKRSNEGYSYDLRNAIAGLTGMEEYVGIVGGGDQTFFLLDLLTRGNELRRVTVVDDSPAQLLNFKELVDIFNTHNGSRYVSSMDREGMRFQRNPCEDWRRHKPRIRKDAEICGVLCDIVEYVRGISEKGTYFLYLSNALFFHMPFERSVEALNAVLENGAIDEGSAVMQMTMGLSECNLLWKASGSEFGIAFSSDPCNESRQGSRVGVREFCENYQRQYRARP
jgi:hypothetical protein